MKALYYSTLTHTLSVLYTLHTPMREVTLTSDLLTSDHWPTYGQLDLLTDIHGVEEHMYTHDLISLKPIALIHLLFYPQ